MNQELGDLPNEMLLQIFSDRILSRHDLCGVARTSRHFQKLATQLIYEVISAFHAGDAFVGEFWDMAESFLEQTETHEEVAALEMPGS